MKIIICKRENLEGETVFIPIMASDDDGENLDRMAEFTEEEVIEFCDTHILCKSSTNIIVDTFTGDSFTY